MNERSVLVTLSSSGEVTYREADGACCHGGLYTLLSDACPECRQLIAEGRWEPAAYRAAAAFAHGMEADDGAL